MEEVKIFYDSKGKPDSVNLPYAEYQQMVQLAKDSMELKKTMSKVNDLIRVFI